MNYQDIAQLIQMALSQGKKVWEVVLDCEAENQGCTRSQIMDRMRERWRVMRESMAIVGARRSMGGLVGGEASLLQSGDGRLFVGPLLVTVMTRALAVAEANACMERIVAAPTAGSCGIIPGALSAVAERMGATEEQVLQALFTASGIGIVLASNASISGAEGGCQAECGSAAAMAAAGVVELVGGDPQQIAEAAALALKNQLGLVCDPVGGLVEVPCVKRNAFTAVHAVVAAQMAVVGIKSVIPVDEVISAMHQIGKAMPQELKETAEGGLAATPTARRLANLESER
ncbi:serine dehydratase [Clostridiales bacterium PH28_bin88]|nr:serine dehydratase [Clostridiales bacterium PH28_bin88]